MKFIKKNCFITGATGGIGKHLASQLALNGCNVFLTGRKEGKLRKLKNNLIKQNKKIEISYEAGNLEKIGDIQEIIKTCKKQFSSIDILINCAGVFPVHYLSKSTLKDFENCFNINVRAPFLFCKEFSYDMMKKRWGRIINIGSSSSYNGFEKTSIYCASKHAILGLSRSLHQELKEYNIRTLCISPGSVKTKMGKKVENQDYETFIEPMEIAEFIIHAISYDSEMVPEEIRLNRMIIK